MDYKEEIIKIIDQIDDDIILRLLYEYALVGLKVDQEQ